MLQVQHYVPVLMPAFVQVRAFGNVALLRGLFIPLDTPWLAYLHPFSSSLLDTDGDTTHGCGQKRGSDVRALADLARRQARRLGQSGTMKTMHTSLNSLIFRVPCVIFILYVLE